jgi:SAM-dependent methyltransferase
MKTAAITDSLHATSCAICGTEGHADERWPASFDPSAFSPEVFSARRLPDRVHYRMVTCRSCGLVRSDPVLDAAAMAELYRESTFDYGDELEGLKTTYGRSLDRLAEVAGASTGLLDIGCGNGFVLEVALQRGWSGVNGVEPSSDAIAQAAPGIAERIVQDIMRPGLFEPGTLGAITLFQVLDHIPDPGALLAECFAALRPGGAILAFNHNVEAISARLLGERSPIVDVEHTYLYSPDTMRRLFSQAGFDVVEVTPARNTYALPYLVHLVPVSRGLRQKLVPALRRSPAARATLTVPLGNLQLVARRPAS